MKGIILAGGSGSRLYPLTIVTSKQLLPVYDKPMIYYPLSTLMMAGIKDILIISTPEDTPRFETLLGDGKKLGIKIQYEVQNKPEGLAQAFLIAEKFIGNDISCMILGDNIFYGKEIKKLLKLAIRNSKNNKATIFGYKVKNPKRFGVVGFNEKGNVNSIEEKPNKPKSNYAVTGLYFYDKRVVNYAKKLKPSNRGELEITDLNRMYLNDSSLEVIKFDDEIKWLDTGTHESLAEAATFVKMLDEKSRIKISYPEEISLNNGWISQSKIRLLAEAYKNNVYGKYLLSLISRNGK